MSDTAINVISYALVSGVSIGSLVSTLFMGVWVFAVATRRPRGDRVRRVSAWGFWAATGLWFASLAFFLVAVVYMANT